MTTHISGPCCDSDIEPGQCKGAFLWDDPDQDQWSEITRIMVDQKNRWILVQSGFIGSFDLPPSEWSWITDPDPDHPKGTHPKSFVWESHVRQQIFVFFEDFYGQKKQNPAWFR